MEIRVLLFVHEETIRRKYLDALANYDVQVFVTPSFFSLNEEVCSHSYHGLLFDLATKMRAIKENKVEVYRLAEKFPVANLRIDSDSGNIRCFHAGRQAGDALADFINSKCRTFEPQKLRIPIRREIYLPVLLSRRPESKRPERSITMDISPGGCFIMTSSRWAEGNEIFLHFPELSDNTPIRAQVRSVVRWGKRRRIPGVEVTFKELSISQSDEITGWWQQIRR